MDSSLPEEASIGDLAGYDQAYPLSCEARSAVDWASYYGFMIDELEFQDRLPQSDNPNRGFVGDPNDLPGQVPPAGYGVHAPPVAALLRTYGLPAESCSGMSVDDLRREISEGRPVIAWVVGHVWNGYGTLYTASDGETLITAHYEHTVIVAAYSASGVKVIDGSWVYEASWDQFLRSWEVLGNMGIIWLPN